MKKTLVIMLSMALLAAVGIIIGACAGASADSSPAPTVDEDRQQAMDAARAALAAKLGVDESTLDVTDVEAVDWPDTSLGAPEPGKMYAQVITPGFRVTIVQGGETYEYHTGKVGAQVTAVLAAK